MVKLFVLSDCATPTGYGRIADEILPRVFKRGVHDVAVAGLWYDGLLPPQYEGERLPYNVSALGGKQNWLDEALKVINAVQPDIICVIQDAPYAEGLRNAPLDWSKMGFIVVTPVDGTPISPSWVQMMKKADAAMVISQFGVDAYRKVGVPAVLLRPGVNPDKCFRLPEPVRQDLRAKLGLDADAFIVGSMCANQGRKAISLMLRAFFEFAADKPSARYLMDMDAVSPAGWHIPMLCEQWGWDVSKIIFRADAQRMGLTELIQRYNVLDAHMVISHREGYGLPLTEAMACGVVSLALDYCSGREIVGDGRGMLIPTTGYGVPGTWGGAEDYFPDMRVLVKSLQAIYESPTDRAAIAERGMKAAREWTWDAAADVFHAQIDRVVARLASIPPKQVSPMQIAQVMQQQGLVPPPQVSPDGVADEQLVALVESDTTL